MPIDEDEDDFKNFHDLELDDRILKAIAKLGWLEPTPIQEKTIPLLLDGKDVLIRARTGSGKTAAFAIPLIQKILSGKHLLRRQVVKGLILAPSKELCKQIHQVLTSLTKKCSREVKSIDISLQVDLSIQKPLLAENPDIVVATPGRALQHLKAGNLNVKHTLETLVIDEADLIFSFGYNDEIKSVLNFLPTVYQAVLASATLSEDVLSLKKLVLHNPAILKLEEPSLAPPSQLTHYTLAAEEIDKAAILYSLLKLHLIRGKSIIFVNTVDRCYKLKLFLEQFGISTCVLNSELPASSRCRAVTQFNSGTYDIIVASDEKSLEESHLIKEKKGKRRKDKESGVARGIDFQFVSNVINFDFPLDVNSYVHRAGRTARGKNQGTVLSYYTMREKPQLDEVENQLKRGYGHDKLFKPYQFKLEEVEGFRYRAKDAWKAVTRIAVREARLKEIKQEVINCEKLKSYFEHNPRDLQSLRQDKALHTVKLQPHLKNVPEYIVPASLKGLINTGKRKRKFDREPGVSGASATKLKYQARSSNPLQSFSISKKNEIKGTYDIVVSTVALLKEIIANSDWTTAKTLIDLITLNGKYLMEAIPLEVCIGNMVRRILQIIREEYISELKNKTEEADPQESLHKILTSEGDQDIDFNCSVPSLKSALIEHINEFEVELETCSENITEQASEHIHSNEIIMTLGRSRLVEDFFKQAATTRAFEVIVAEGGPCFNGHEMAVNLAKAKIKTTLISDVAIFAMMSRVNKVIIGTHTVMANGGLKSITGSHTVAQAAKHYSVPVMVLLPLYKLSPLYLCSYEQNAFNRHVSPTQGVINGTNAPLIEKIQAYNPVFDYVPPQLVTLFISNSGGNAPSYIYRLLSELYHPDDYEL